MVVASIMPSFQLFPYLQDRDVGANREHMLVTFEQVGTVFDSNFPRVPSNEY